MNISDTIEALNFALDVARIPRKHFDAIRALADALKAGTIVALPDQVGEPVAWRYTHKLTKGETFSNQPPDRVSYLEEYDVTPLYASPPPAQVAPYTRAEEVAHLLEVYLGTHDMEKHALVREAIALLRTMTAKPECQHIWETDLPSMPCLKCGVKRGFIFGGVYSEDTGRETLHSFVKGT
jgi:hypothetical protein